MDREEARRGIRAWLLCRKGLSVKRGVHKVDVFLVHPVLRQPQTLTEALEMNDLARSEEFNDVVDVGIIGKTQNVVICGAGFLLCRQIFGQIGDQVSLDGHAGGTPRKTGGGCGIDAGSAVNKVGVEACCFDLILREVTGQLMNDRANYFQMAQFLGTDIGQQTFQLRIRHTIPLAQISQRSAQLAVRAAVLGNNDGGQLRVGIFDFYCYCKNSINICNCISRAFYVLLVDLFMLICDFIYSYF